MLISKNKKNLHAHEFGLDKIPYLHEEWYLQGKNKDGSQRIVYSCEVCKHTKKSKNREVMRRHMRTEHQGEVFF